MPPKGPATKDKDIAPVEEDVIQAVILAESFNKRFKPLTIDRPRASRANRHLSSRCDLMFAVASACYLYAMPLYWTGHLRVSPWRVCRRSSSCADHIRTLSRLPSSACSTLSPHPAKADFSTLLYRESKWSKPGSGLKIVPIVTAKQTFTPGDALRDIYTHGIITNDFVLVTGDLVSNIRIDEVVRVHKERRKVDRDAIMTMVVKESGVVHRTRFVRVTSGRRLTD